MMVQSWTVVLYIAVLTVALSLGVGGFYCTFSTRGGFNAGEGHQVTVCTNS